MRELDERVDVLSLTLLVAWRGSTQSSTCVEGGLVRDYTYTQVTTGHNRTITRCYINGSSTVAQKTVSMFPDLNIIAL